jgi:23S rRNA (uridine2552-2'-O)-methyltransferase
MKRRSTAKKNRWEDHYTRKARKEKYPARSVYKLQEIQRKFRLIKKGQRVLDLGCFPGSWLLYAAELTGKGGRVVGIDLKPVGGRLPANAKAFTGDIFEMDATIKAALAGGFNVVLSDMAPATTGNKDVDAARSFDLGRAALTIAENHLLPGGAFVCKIFQGEDFKAFTERVKAGFQRCASFKPQSSRKASREIFIVAMGKK